MFDHKDRQTLHRIERTVTQILARVMDLLKGQASIVQILRDIAGELEPPKLTHITSKLTSP